MRRLYARRAASTCAIAVTAVAGLVAPGVASAKKAAAANCSGSNIVAAGSTLQKLAQKSIWEPDFNTSKNAQACSGALQPTVGPYESIGSGEGLEDWGYNGHAFEAGRVAVVATDEPVNAAEKDEIEANEKEKGSAPASIQSIPVLQAAVAIIVHLPANCTATSTAAPGRLVLDNVTLEAIWKGTINNWSEIKDDGDSVSGSGCVATTPFTRLVRLDQSGTTHILKKYLNIIDSSPQATEAHGEQTWNELSEGDLNTVWPTKAHVQKASAEGGGALVTEVAKVESSIGYASLADARSNGGFSKTGVGGANTAKFWVELQNNGSSTKKGKYSDPATNGDEEKLGNSKCGDTKYTNGQGTKFPPASTSAVWNEVTTATKEKNYPLCGITYDTTFSKYSAYPGTTEGEAITAKQFLAFVLESGAEGGQKLILNNDYEPLPAKLLKEAKAGAALTKF
jgi:ABC-type phosphate transport system substrate-binding protein